ncbi:MAG: arsenate reductase ArsC [Armatimonadetes bacterium]|nr:arsenate reductase ArsC [Armatimonadota bacterium]
MNIGGKRVKKVLFVCIHNSGRSQMAEAFANRLGAGVIEAHSAGTAPADAINPDVVKAMQEIGYDMEGQYPKLMTNEMLDMADLVVTMGCGVNLDSAEQGGAVCPVVLVESEDWGLEDPRDKPIAEVRKIRDQVKTKVEELLEMLKTEVQQDE